MMYCRLLYFISLYLFVNGADEQIQQNPQCTLPNGKLGECVIYYLCDDKGEIIDDGSTILDSRFGPAPINCTEKMNVCCSLHTDGDSIVSNVTDNPTRIDISTSTNSQTTSNTIIQTPTICGTRTFTASSTNTDKESQFGEFPWMVAILTESTGSDKYTYICGGSLIHPSVVLTAAHCLDSAKVAANYIIRAGEWDTQSDQEPLPYQEKKVESFVKHTHFYRGPLFHDLALLFLDSPVSLAENVAVVCLAPDSDPDPIGDRCLSSGWGKDNYGKSGVYKTILKKVELPVLDKSSCQKALRTTRLGLNFQLHHSFMCAGGEGLDTCSGDGGSPLVCTVPVDNINRFVQYGIVSWGIGCGDDGIPGVYAKTASHRQWIDDQIYLKGFTPYDF